MSCRVGEVAVQDRNVFNVFLVKGRRDVGAVGLQLRGFAVTSTVSVDPPT